MAHDAPEVQESTPPILCGIWWEGHFGRSELVYLRSVPEGHGSPTFVFPQSGSCGCEWELWPFDCGRGRQTGWRLSLGDGDGAESEQEV